MICNHLNLRRILHPIELIVLDVLVVKVCYMACALREGHKLITHIGESVRREEYSVVQFIVFVLNAIVLLAGMIIFILIVRPRLRLCLLAHYRCHPE